MRVPASAPAAAIAAWPDGNDAVFGRASIIFTAITSNGRGRSNSGFATSSTMRKARATASHSRHIAAV